MDPAPYQHSEYGSGFGLGKPNKGKKLRICKKKKDAILKAGSAPGALEA